MRTYDPVEAKRLDLIFSKKDPCYRQAMEMLNRVRRQDDPVWRNIHMFQLNMAISRQNRLRR